MTNYKNHNHKFTALDSLRGIAALMVVFQHFWEMNHPSDSRLKPWLCFCAGHEAVILFFVLSGFVLSHQLREFNFRTYPEFIAKRILRIYPAYYVAILLSATMLIYISRFHPSALLHHGLTRWFYIWSQTHFDNTLLWGSLTIISHPGSSLDVAIWTLFYEVWISLVFPFLLWGLFKASAIINIILVSVLVALSYWFWLQGIFLDNPWVAILYYVWYFILGMLIYHYTEKLKFLANPIFLVLALMLYFSNFLLFGKITSRLIHELLIGAGSGLLILSCIHNSSLKVILNFIGFRFYGRISYSLYLFHLPLLYTISYLFLPSYNIVIIKATTLVVTTLLATLSYYLIELKFIKLAKKHFLN